MTWLFIIACGIITLLVFFMFIILKKTVKVVNSQTKTYFVDKLQAYDSLIDEKEQKLNEIEKDMILHHMWPVTIIPPKTKEGFLLTLIDKYCAMIEIKKGLINNLNTNFYFNYFYLMFVIMIGKL